MIKIHTKLAAIALLTALAVTGAAGGALYLGDRSGHADAHSNPAKSQLISLGSEPTQMGPGRATASTDDQIRGAQAQVRKLPGQAVPYVTLAAAYMQKARETGDVTYYTLTDEALKSALRIDPKNYDAITYEAWVHLARHDFVGARSVSETAIKANPYDSANYGTLGDADANLGKYSAMLKAYQRMVTLKPGMPAYNRASYARWLYGDVEGAYRMMMMAIRAGSAQPENVAWCYSQLGDDYMAGGYVIGAQQAYQRALRTFPHYAPALAGLASVQLALGHSSAAVKDFRAAIAVIPLPQYVISLGDLYTRLGNREAAARQYALVDFIDRTFTLNHVRYGVEEAQYYADHNLKLHRALTIVTAELATRKDIKTWDTDAWVLYKNGRAADAWKAEQQALRLGTRDASMYFHAGMIQAKLGDASQAQSYLHSALTLNPNFHVLYPAVARNELLKLGKRTMAAPAPGR